jgi:hypothetical protein
MAMIKDETPKREEIERLLPWYATGKLDREDMSRVSAWLAEHQDAARQLELIREERAESERANRALGTPSPQALDRLMTSIGAQKQLIEPQKRTQRRALGAAWSAVTDFFAAPTPGAVRWAAMAAAAVAIIQAAVIFALAFKTTTGNHGGGNGFHLAAGREPGTEGGATLLIAFTDTATAPAITGFLGEFNASIVAGPKPGGVYKVVFRSPDADLKGLMQRVSGRKDIVRLVLPGGN